jgi:hypothetical protein
VADEPKREAHEVYKELSTAVNDLGKDMVKGLVALRAVSSDNKADIERIEHRLEKRLDAMQKTVEKLVRAEGNAEGRLKALEGLGKQKAEADGKVRVESAKGRWAFWVAVVGGGAGFATALLQMIAKAAGWD